MLISEYEVVKYKVCHLKSGRIQDSSENYSKDWHIYFSSKLK